MHMGFAAPIDGGKDVIVTDPERAERARRCADQALQVIRAGESRHHSPSGPVSSSLQKTPGS